LIFYLSSDVGFSYDTAYRMMQGVIMSAKAITLVGTIGSLGTDLVIKAITTTSSALVSGVSEIMKTKHPYADDIKKLLESLDIVTCTTVIGCIITEQTQDNIPDSINKALHATGETLEKINDEILEINKQIAYHDTVWFQNWRTIDCSANIERIKELKGVFDKRFDLLNKTIMIYHSGKKNTI